MFFIMWSDLKGKSVKTFLSTDKPRYNLKINYSKTCKTKKCGCTKIEVFQAKKYIWPLC